MLYVKFDRLDNLNYLQFQMKIRLGKVNGQKIRINKIKFIQTYIR